MNPRRRNFLALLLVIGAPLLISQWWKIHLLLDPIDSAALDKNSVVLYSTSWCPYCEKTRQFLQQANIPFSEKDIEQSEQAAAEHRALGGVGIPLLKINAQIIDGYDPQAIRAAIETPQQPMPAHHATENKSSARPSSVKPLSPMLAPELPLTP